MLNSLPLGFERGLHAVRPKIGADSADSMGDSSTGRGDAFTRAWIERVAKATQKRKNFILVNGLGRIVMNGVEGNV